MRSAVLHHPQPAINLNLILLINAFLRHCGTTQWLRSPYSLSFAILDPQLSSLQLIVIVVLLLPFLGESEALYWSVDLNPDFPCHDLVTDHVE